MLLNESQHTTQQHTTGNDPNRTPATSPTGHRQQAQHDTGNKPRRHRQGAQYSTS
jgi:hypothetical protein